MLSLSEAMISTGAGTLLADSILSLLGSSPSPRLLVGMLFTVAWGLTQFVSNTASTALLAPIGLAAL